MAPRGAGISRGVTRYLTNLEVAELDELFLLAFHAVEGIRQRASVGRALHAVKVPPRLSEGIVVNHCRDVFRSATQVAARRPPHDVTLRTHRRLNVAVKGSGLTDWAVITTADRQADVLVWVDYRDRLLDPAAPVLVRRIRIAALAPDRNRAFLRALCADVTAVAVHPGRPRTPL